MEQICRGMGLTSPRLEKQAGREKSAWSPQPRCSRGAWALEPAKLDLS